MTLELSHWDEISQALDVRDQMGWQFVQHCARIGALLIEQQGDLSLRRFVKQAQVQDRRLTRSTVSLYQQVHRNMGLLQQSRPDSLNEARRLITDHNRPPVTVQSVRQPQTSHDVGSDCPTVGQPQTASRPQAAPAPQPQTAPMPAGSAEETRPAWSVTTEMRELAEWVETTSESAPTYGGAEMVIEALFAPNPMVSFCLDLDQQYAVAKYLMDWWRIVRDPNIDSTVSVWMDPDDEDPTPDLLLHWFPTVEMLDEIERHPR